MPLDHAISVGTVENHGKAEITETMIFIKYSDFAKMLFCRVFYQNAVSA